MAEVRTRRDVWKLDEWDPILLWYARAIADMQKRPIKNPTSWRYQAAIHDYVRRADPNAKPGERLPSTAEQNRFWRQCQHFSWFFLPWHRMYLAFFERIVAASVRRLGGPADWALPYWNYSATANQDARRLPPAFRAARLPDGSANPLRVERRAEGANDGSEIATLRQVDLEDCLVESSFISQPTGGAAGFGGPRTGFKHTGQLGDVVGDLERTPHGSMHVAVGGRFPDGSGGWMSTFHTAGLDPVFWLHHCNIDRLWAVWLGRAPGNANPTEVAWLRDQPFEFHDENGDVVRMTCEQVGDTTTPPLSYEYEDVSDPLPGGPQGRATRRTAVDKRLIPEMVGATDEPMTLEGESASTSLPVSQPTGPARRGVSAASSRVFLNLENITSTGVPDSYAVFVNLLPGANPEAHPELYAGLLPMFGVAESSVARSEHPGDGVHYSLEITDIVRTLEARGDWKPDELRVTFVPERPEAARRSTSGASVQVGRVSLYYS